MKIWTTNRDEWEASTLPKGIDRDYSYTKKVLSGDGLRRVLNHPVLGGKIQRVLDARLCWVGGECDELQSAGLLRDHTDDALRVWGRPSKFGGVSDIVAAVVLLKNASQSVEYRDFLGWMEDGVIATVPAESTPCQDWHGEAEQGWGFCHGD